MRNLLVAFALLSPSIAAAQIPPPPISSLQEHSNEVLKKAYENKDIGAYSSLLNSDVQVLRDGTIIAKSKTKWLEQFRNKFLAEGVTFKIVSSYSSVSNNLNIEYFNSVASFPGNTGHCCWRYDAVQYTFNATGISRIYILSGGDVHK